MKKLILLNDEPIGMAEKEREDGLGFTTYSQVISETIRGTPGPFTIGVFGEWGTGKTSLLQLIQQDLDKDDNFVTVWFNAWMFEKEIHPLLPLLATIIEALYNSLGFWEKIPEKKDKFLNALRAVAYGFASKTKLKVPGFAEIEASFVAKDMIDRERALSADPLLDKALYYNAFHKLKSIALPPSQKIVVIIDDLDRCFPDKAIKLLESIKLILSQQGFIFVIGVSRKVIEGYLQHRYEEKYGLREFEGYKYLDKIVQLGFPIPPHTQRFENFYKVLLNQLDTGDRDSLTPILSIVGAACEYNPRTTVRFINNLLIDLAISSAVQTVQDKKEISVGYFAITRGLQQRWEKVYQEISFSDELCKIFSEINDNLLMSLSTSEDADSQEANLARNILDDPDLRILLSSPEGKDWLKNGETRQFAIDFLRTQRQQSDDEEFTAKGKIRVYELARDLNLTNQIILSRLAGLGIKVKSHMSPLNDEDVKTIKNAIFRRIDNDIEETRVSPNVIKRRRKSVKADLP